MANRSYNKSGKPTFSAFGASSDIRAEFSAIEDGFAELEGELDAKGPIFKGAMAYNNDLTASGNTVNWASSSYDTDSIHSLITHTDRLVVPAGVVAIRITGQLATLSGTATVLKNGSAAYVGGVKAVSNENFSSAVLTVVEDDYFTVEIATGELTADSTGASNWFALEVVKVS